MYLARGRPAGAGSEQRTETFTGTVFADPVVPTTDGNTAANVFFAPGARTYWHRHEHGQFLHVTLGSGLVCSDGEQPRVLTAGDTVWVPAGERHWHGGGPDTCLSHLAISLGTTTWFEPVDEADYGRAARPGDDAGPPAPGTT
jgi:quercetin dioxygenase-like cupin family protein